MKNTIAGSALDDVVRLACTTAGARFGALALRDRTGERIVAAIGVAPADLPDAGSLIGLTGGGSAPVLVTDASRDPRFRAHPLVTGAPGLRWFVAVPLTVVGDGAAGALWVAGSASAVPAGPAIEALEASARLASAAVEAEEACASEVARGSEAAYRTIFELANDAMFVHDLKTGAILDANRRATEQHGYTVAEMRAGGVPLLTCRESLVDWDASRERLNRAAAGEVEVFEWLGKHRSGRELWLEVSLRRITLAGGDRLLAITRDVTDRREAHAQLERAYGERTEELRRSEAHFRQIIENSSDIATVLDPDGVVVYQSHSIQRILGWTPEEVTGRSAFDLIHPDDVPDARAGIARAMAGAPRPEGTTVRFRHRDGRWRMLEVRARNIDDAAPGTGVIANSRDVTERIEAERELRLQKMLLEAQGEASIDGILVVSQDGRIVSHNRRFIELWNIPPEPLDGRPGGDAEALESAFEQVADPVGFRDRVAHLYEHPDEESHDEIVLKDGRVLDRFSGPVRGPDGQRFGRIWWFRDITPRKLAQQALQRAMEEADQAREAAELANRAKSEFLSRMSHDLRTPLNSVLGFAQLLQRKVDAPDQRKSVDHILRAGRHLLNLINEVLDIARIESNRQHLSLEPVRVGAAIQESLNLIRPLATQRGCTIEPTPDPDGDPYVRADRQRLTQILLNLLSNAIKYNRPDGRVWISFHGPVPAPGQEGASGRFRIGVHDTGPGIPADRLDRLFTPFERLGAEQSDVEGTGLGLALSHRLAEAMGGSLEVTSGEGEGSAFWLELELADRPALPAPARDRRAARIDAPTSPWPRATVLYIEDNLANLTLVESMLEARPGLSLISALQGRLGLELARQHAPDLILLDLHLPDMHGADVLTGLREDPRTAGIPVLVISADATEDTIRRLRAANVADYLTKPLDLDAFLAAVDRAITRFGKVRT